MATAGGGNNSKADFQIYRYRLVRKIGSGSFGDIYLGVNITNGEVRLENACPLVSIAEVNVFWLNISLGTGGKDGIGQGQTSPITVRVEIVQNPSRRCGYSSHKVSLVRVHVCVSVC